MNCIKDDNNFDDRAFIDQQVEKSNNDYGYDDIELPEQLISEQMEQEYDQLLDARILFLQEKVSRLHSELNEL